MNIKRNIFYIILFLSLTINCFSNDIKLKFVKSYSSIKIKSYNTDIKLINSDTVLIYDKELNNVYLIENINKKSEKINALSHQLNTGELINIEKKIIYIDSIKYKPYTFNIKDKNFIQNYNKEKELYYSNNKIFYKDLKLTQIFPLIDDMGDIISLESASYITKFKDKLFFINENALDNIWDLWIYDYKNNYKNILSDDVSGYIILEDNLIFVCKSKKINIDKDIKEYYLIDFESNIINYYKEGSFDKLYFNSGIVLDNNQLLLSGSNDKNESKIMLFKYRLSKNKTKIKSKLVEKLVYKSTVNLKIRSDQTLKSKVKTVLKKGDYVRLLEKGNSATIDGIKSFWFKVRTLDGVDGWCFGGYLEEVKKK